MLPSKLPHLPVLSLSHSSSLVLALLKILTEVIHRPRGTECMPWPILYQGELVGDPPLWRQFGPKAIGWEQLVTVVVLDDLSHCLEGHGISAELVGTHVVQRGRLQGIPCGEMVTCLSLHESTYQPMHPPLAMNSLNL